MSTSPTAFRWALVAAIAMLPSAARAQEPLTAFNAVELALARNPELNAMAAEVRAADARVDGASLVLQANPELGGAVGPRLGADSDRVDYGAELSQQLEIFGQRGARIDVARAGRAGATARLHARRAEIAADVRQAFGRALAAEQLLTFARESLELARQTAKAAETRLELGDGSRIEVNTARVEVGRATRELSLALGARAAALANLRLLIALDPTTELRLHGDLTTPFVTPAEGDGLERRALRNRAERVAAEQDVEGARAEQRFAGRDWLPRPRVGVRYEKDECDDVVLGTLSFDLPVFNQSQAARGVATAQLNQAERALEAIQRRIRQEVGVEWASSRFEHSAAGRAGTRCRRGRPSGRRVATTASADDCISCGAGFRADGAQHRAGRRGATAARDRSHWLLSSTLLTLVVLPVLFTAFRTAQMAPTRVESARVES